MSWNNVVKTATPPPAQEPIPFETKMTNSTSRPSTIVGIDFETYYGKNFSLRKITTTTYVRGLQKSEIHGASIAVNGGTPQWYAGQALEDKLNAFDWASCALLAHNAAFDGFILTHHYGHVAAYYYDSMSMARGLHSHDISASLKDVAKYYGTSDKLTGVLESVENLRWHEFSDQQKTDMVRYCDQDVTVMWEIFHKMLPAYPQDELDLIDLSIKAFVRPLIVVDFELVKSELIREIKEEDDFIAKVAAYFGVTPQVMKTGLSSNPKFAEILKELGVQVPMKPSPSDPTKLTYAFAKNDIAFQNLGIHADERVRDVISARKIVKSTIGQSRANRLLEHSHDGTQPIPIMLNYCKAHTMRWTGGDKLNPQNFPSGRTSSKLRHTLTAPKGMKMVVIDSSQIEDRMNAYVAGQTDVLEAYANGEDNYKLMASKIYQVPVEEVTKQQRFVGKVSRLGLGYQCGYEKFKYMLRSGAMGPAVTEEDLSDDEIYKAHTTYRNVSRHVVNNWYYMQDRLIDMRYGNERLLHSGYTRKPLAKVVKDGILMPNGLKLHYPDIREGGNGLTYKGGYNLRAKIYGGLLTENYIQCLARIVVGEQMLKIAQQFDVIMMTHDEVVYLAPTAVAQEAYEYGLDCMTWVPDWCEGLPVDAEGDIGDNYGEIK